MAWQTTVQTNVYAYIRRLRNPEKKRYAANYAAAWLTGSAYPNAASYGLSRAALQDVQFQITQIFYRYGRRSGGES
jgi:hypothetical protein